jgi:hypothetical protein
MAITVTASPKNAASSTAVTILANDALSVTDLNQTNLEFGDGSSDLAVEDGIVIEDGTSVVFNVPALSSLTSDQPDTRIVVLPGATITVGSGFPNTVVEGMIYKLAVS